MKDNIVVNKSFAFAVRVVKLSRHLNDKKKEFVLAKQLLRSGTAICALLKEAEHAKSKADFIHKASIALKEANETNYWLELLFKTEYISELEYKSIIEDSTELIKLLTSIIKTSKQNIKK